MRDTFVRVLVDIAGEDARVYFVTGDLGFGALDPFVAAYPDRYINAGVAEQNMTGLATGLALTGKVVFTYSIANFPTLRCLEQIRNDACYHMANVKVVAVGGGFSYGALGISHHATEDISVMRALPNITVVAPGDLWEAAEATRALVGHKGTCYLRLDKTHAPPTQHQGEVFQLGKGRTVRSGNDATIITCGGILGVVLDAADALAEEGISCRVVSMHTVKPLDVELILAACSETGGIVTVEENTVEGGLGSAVAEACCDAGVFPPWLERIGLREGFSCIVGSQQYLRERYGLDAAAIVKAVKRRVRQK